MLHWKQCEGYWLCWQCVGVEVGMGTGWLEDGREVTAGVGEVVDVEGVAAAAAEE